MKHKLIEVRSSGERKLAERSHTAVCACGWEESCRRKKDALAEYSLHYTRMRRPEAT